jgi:signal transduction histidine kinase
MLTVPTELPLQREIQQALYRVAQEALSNIQRHAGARTASLTITTTNDAVSLHIADDGTGIDQSNIGGGTGLAGIRERIQMMGGRVDINSDATGTDLMVQLPAKPDEECSD